MTEKNRGSTFYLTTNVVVPNEVVGRGVENFLN
jgi:hypothetical protein